ncbi:hypothetical protein ACLOJK_024596 [Asimina triloba]
MMVLLCPVTLLMLALSIFLYRILWEGGLEKCPIERSKEIFIACSQVSVGSYTKNSNPLSQARLCCEPLADSNASARSPHSAIVDFFRLLYGSSFALSFWPPSYPLELISSFFADLFGYSAGAADNNPDFASAAGPIVAEIIIAAVLRHNDDPAGIAKAFLSAISKNCPLIPAPDADNLVGCLLDEFVAAGEASTSVPGVSGSSLSSSLPVLVAQSEASSLSSPHVQTNGDSSPVSEMSVTSSPSGVAVRSGSKGKGEYRESGTDDDGGSASSASSIFT